MRNGPPASTAREQPENPTDKLSAALVILLAVVGLAHALFLPAFEGPDEPFHLARADLDAGGRLPLELAGSVRSLPCGPDLHRAMGCPPFGDEPAAWNLLSPPETPETWIGETPENYQEHQPPLAYLGMAIVVKALGLERPTSRLLALRLAAVFLVIGGVLAMREVLSRDIWILWATGLLLPGATESLVRVSNDVPVFFWAALCLWLLHRERTWATAGVTVLGPLIKLTAFPVVIFVAASLWFRGDRKPAAVAAALSGLIVPLQWLRGWAWGGTLELNTGFEARDSLLEILVGVLHSGYTFLKTAFWLGGWSVFRPPVWLLVLAVAVALLYGSRLRAREDWRQAAKTHGPALLLAAIGFVAFAVGKRHLFGVWGAVGGWYFWPWTPWLAVTFQQSLRLDVRGKRWILPMALLILLSRWAWFHVAIGLYGVP